MGVTLVDHPDAWAQLCTESFVSLGVTSIDERFSARLTQARFDDGTRVTRVASRGSRVFRSRRNIAQDDSDDLLFAIHGRGTGHVYQDGRHAHLRTGLATLYDTAFPYELHFNGPMSETVLQVPRHVIDPSGALIGRLTANVFLPSDTRLLSLERLMHTAAKTATPAERDSHGDRVSLQQVLEELLRSMIQDPSNTRVRRSPAALRAEAQTLINRQSSNPDLTPTEVAAQIGIPLRSLQSAYKQTSSTLAEQIRQARIETSTQLLRSGSTVTTAAFEAGFRDTSTFNRAFFQVKAQTPSSFRAGLKPVSGEETPAAARSPHG